jgi:molecular chaperone DnaJ
VQVDVPPGVAQNHYITLRGQGLAGPRNGPPGDLLVEFEIEDDPRFERRGDDLVYTLPLSFSQAGLGADVKVPTPYGEERLSLPAGTQSGTVFTLRGKGLPNVGDGRRGVLYVRTHVWTPTRLTGELKAVLQGLSEVEGDPPKDERQGRRLWDKVKEAFGT